MVFDVSRPNYQHLLILEAINSKGHLSQKIGARRDNCTDALYTFKNGRCG